MSLETIIHILTTLGALLVAGIGFVRHVDKTSAIHSYKLDNLGKSLDEHRFDTRQQISELKTTTTKLAVDVAELRGIERSNDSKPPRYR